MSVDALVPVVRSALGVSASYDDEKIPALIRRTINRLLRDYHFPKSVRKATFGPALLGDFQFPLPVGFKQELELRYYDPVGTSWSDPLRKKQGFQLPYPTGVPYYYWLEGTNLVVDTPYSAAMIGYSTFLWYESMDAEGNEDWLITDYEDSVFLASVVKGCAEFRKPDVMQTYGALWTDERQSLAQFLEELNWNNSEIYMREAKRGSGPRYPR